MERAERWLGVRVLVNNPGGPAHTGLGRGQFAGCPGVQSRHLAVGQLPIPALVRRRAAQPGVRSDAMFLCKNNVTDSYRTKLRAVLARPLQILTPFFWVLQHRQRLELCGQI